MSELTTVSVRHTRQQIAAVFRRAEFYFGNAREVLSDDIGVVTRRAAEFVKVNLLIEIHVFPGTFVVLRIAGVVKAARVFVPGDAASPRGILHARNYLRKFPAGGSFED